jgi:hypothetical protein
VNISGSATARATFTANLTSVKAGLNGAARTKGTAAGAAPAAETFTFTVPNQDVDDFNLSLSFVPGYREDASIRRTFGTPVANAALITDEKAAFEAVKAYLDGRTAAQLVSDGIIRLGDYIDLDSLTVPRIPNINNINNPGTYPLGAPRIMKNDPIPVSAAPYPGYEGTRLRIIVVGINSFNTRDRDNANANLTYEGTNTGGKAHVVFQFQNIIVKGNMNREQVTTGGWKRSNMREYLLGDFFTGLKNAGVPDTVLFSVKRTGDKPGVPVWDTSLIPISSWNFFTNLHDQTTEDPLWLPTELEMFGSRGLAENTEKLENQARLEYYSDDFSRIKLYADNTTASLPPFSPIGYWTASPVRWTFDGYLDMGDTPSEARIPRQRKFCGVTSNGIISDPFADTSANIGIAPAFVIKGN